MDIQKLKNHIFTPEEEELISQLKTGRYIFKEIDGEKYYINKNKWFHLYNDVYEFHKFSNVKVKTNKTFKPPSITQLGFKDLVDLKNYIYQVTSQELGMSIDDIKEEIDKPNSSKILELIGKDWEKSLDVDQLYGNDNYLLETIHCSLHVTSSLEKNGVPQVSKCLYKLLKTFYQMGLNNNSLNIIDFGSGIGLTTLFMGLYLPNSTIYYNELNQKSRSIFKKLLKHSGLKNIKVIEEDEWDNLPPLDVLVGIEFFEHIPNILNPKIGDPMLVVDEWLPRCVENPMVIMNTYWNDSNQALPSLGHFEEYMFDDNEVVKRWNRGKKSPQMMFNKCMKSRGYQRLDGIYWDWRNHGVCTYIRDNITYNNPPQEFFLSKGGNDYEKKE